MDTVLKKACDDVFDAMTTLTKIRTASEKNTVQLRAVSGILRNIADRIDEEAKDE